MPENYKKERDEDVTSIFASEYVVWWPLSRSVSLKLTKLLFRCNQFFINKFIENTKLLDFTKLQKRLS